MRARRRTAVTALKCKRTFLVSVQLLVLRYFRREEGKRLADKVLVIPTKWFLELETGMDGWTDRTNMDKSHKTRGKCPTTRSVASEWPMEKGHLGQC